MSDISLLHLWTRLDPTHFFINLFFITSAVLLVAIPMILILLDIMKIHVDTNKVLKSGFKFCLIAAVFLVLNSG